MAPNYRLHKLVCPDGRRAFYATHITNAGTVVGAYSADEGGLRGLAAWKAPYDDGTVVAFSMREGLSVFPGQINDAGDVVGTYTVKGGGDDARALFASMYSDSVSPLAAAYPHKVNGPGLISWKGRSGVSALNAAGVTIGHRVRRGALVGFVWSPQSGFAELASHGEGDTNPQSINSVGTIAGTAKLNTARRVIIWDARGAVIDELDVDALSVRISDAGHILCQGHLPGLISSAQVRLGGASVVLPPAAGCRDATGVDINSHGMVVGEGRPSFNSKSGMIRIACLWDSEGNAHDLNSLIEDASVRLRSATSINDSGWIVCWGGAVSDKWSSPYLLEPVIH